MAVWTITNKKFLATSYEKMEEHLSHYFVNILLCT